MGEVLKKLPNIVVLFTVALSLAFRVWPAWDAVFTSHGVSFQEPDAWYHMRTIHNLEAHFPHRSAFDPYSAFHFTENIPFGPFWDYLVGTVAWLAGAGAPSDATTDLAGAWLPAILGALLPVLVFVLVRRLFGEVEGMFGSVWVALIPGTFLWISHLGMADHHAAETFTSFLALTLLCVASEVPLENRWRWVLAALSGVALAAYLETRPAGVFVPAVFAMAAVLSPALAPLVAVSIGVACLIVLPAESTSPWAQYTRLALIGALAISLPLAILHAMASRRNWSRILLYATALGVALFAAGCLVVVDGARVQGLFALIRTYLVGKPEAELASVVTELQPLWQAAPGGVASLINQFGVAWVFAVPGLALLLRRAWRGGRPGLVLFSVWSLVMLAGVWLQLRMGAYAGLVVSILAGVFSAWLVRAIAGRVPKYASPLRAGTAGIVILAAMGTALPVGYAQTHAGQGPDRDWFAALEWLRGKTPEPLGTSEAWYQWWPRLAPGGSFKTPASAYSVIAQWDKGWWISSVARRIPAANGELHGSIETAQFLMETDPDQALQDFRAMDARYAMIGPGSITLQLPALVKTAGRKIDDYSRVIWVHTSGGWNIETRVYLPVFYRSMAARLYLFDGRSFDTSKKGVQVFLPEPEFTDAGAFKREVNEMRSFASADAARAWIVAHPAIPAYLASPDATVSCVDLPDLTWAQETFASRDEPLNGSQQPSVVKVFELFR